ncbi:hypothetical protein [Brevibacterium sp. XM4083]|uniref:hypothetical protein n=1 Tax=Brevibacterium sp. XM4083 TaxID=2583238 RepID=UPI00112D8D36|nr:hypothetical protein [Brevibacterium sp. XM4083]MCM1012299.1 hypothetical protein [Brevibacterium sp. XM4083]
MIIHNDLLFIEGTEVHAERERKSLHRWEELVMMVLLIVVGMMIGVLLIIGRAVCPAAERLAWQDLGLDGWVVTAVRGWAAVSGLSRLETMTEQMHRRRS